MEKINCIIVEDEPLAVEILVDYIKQVPFLHLKAICNDALYAMEILKSLEIQLVFLDIHLPKLKGIDFIKTLHHPPKVIITTAYRDYAIEGFELAVLDYLLKPINFNRFLVAVNKLKPLHSSSGTGSIQTPVGSRSHVFFNVNKKMVKVYFDEIIYIESFKEYVRIVSKDRSILTKMQLTQVEELLSKDYFIRVHRSFLVSKEKIEAFTATDIDIVGKQIPIGRNYKQNVLLQLTEGQ